MSFTQLTARRRIVAARLAMAAAMAPACAAAAMLLGAAAAAESGPPHFDQAGRMIFPADYRSWVFLSSGIDMSYSRTPAMASGHVFNNVFVPRAAYDSFQATGKWPDGTVLMLENRGGAADVSINKRGLVQTGDVMGLEAHVKDLARFKSGWGFFAFDGGKPADRIPVTATCYSCHQDHAAVDTTFVQFYPTLLPVAARQATLSGAYLAETGARQARP